MKKYVSYASLTFVGVAALLAILGLFGVPIFSGVMSQILFTDIALAVASILLIDTIELAANKNIIAIISTALIALSLLLFFGVIWGSVALFASYGQVTVVISLISMEFSVIVGNIVKLGRAYLALQIIVYALLTFIIGAICLAIFQVIGVSIFLMVWFWAVVIITFALSIALKVFAKKVATDKLESRIVKAGYISVNEAEYKALLEENAELKRKLAEYEAADNK